MYSTFIIVLFVVGVIVGVNKIISHFKTKQFNRTEQIDRFLEQFPDPTQHSSDFVFHWINCECSQELLETYQRFLNKVYPNTYNQYIIAVNNKIKKLKNLEI